MTDPLHQRPARTRKLSLWGPVSFVGAVYALLAFLADQGFKFLMLGVYDMDNWVYPRIRITPFFDIVLAWNRGVSYGLFAQHTELGRWLLVGISVITVAALWVWMARFTRPLPAAGVGLITGGALANALDRVIHGAVADFFWFHYGKFSWYVFNAADVAIVAGALLVLYDSFVDGDRSDGKSGDDTVSPNSGR